VSLFDTTPPGGETPPNAPPETMDSKRPLAQRMRPERLEDYVGQEHILGPGKPLRRFSADTVFWSWHFVAEGKQVAYCQNSLHPGPSPPSCELHDVETGRLIDDNRNSTGKSPDWMAGLAEE